MKYDLREEIRREEISDKEDTFFFRVIKCSPTICENVLLELFDIDHCLENTKGRFLSQANIPESICVCQCFEQTLQSLYL